MELFIGHHIEVTGTGQTEQNGLAFARFLAAQRFVNRAADGVCRLGGGQDGFLLGDVTPLNTTKIVSRVAGSPMLEDKVDMTYGVVNASTRKSLGGPSESSSAYTRNAAYDPNGSL